MTESTSRQGKANVFLLPRSCFYLFIYSIYFFCAFLASTLSQSEFNAKNNLANIQPSQLSSRVVNNAYVLLAVCCQY